jgi:2-amino-4-hydroxy-6-hydroxymethyldihydropteridine diphosphokinase
MGRAEPIGAVREPPPEGSGTRPVVIAFGANLGDRRTAIAEAARAVGRLLDSFRLSSLVETVPVGAGLERDPLFMNAVGVGQSSLPARALLDALAAIEGAAGRARSTPGAPRTLDLDLILAGDEVLNEPGLQVPHPRFRDRLFVLEPLAEIAPNLRDPVTGLTISQLLQERRDRT